MHRGLSDSTKVLDAAAGILVDSGLSALTIGSLARRSGVSEAEILSTFGSIDDALIVMLNREFTSIYLSIVDSIERDPRGGLLSRIFFYTLTAVYERPLARVLYTEDPDAMNTIMRNANSAGYVPGVAIRSEFIEQMQLAGMVRREIDASTVSTMLTVFSAGLALTAPHRDLDRIVRGITDLLARSVDTDAEDTAGGKQAFYAWAMSLSDGKKTGNSRDQR